MGSNTKIEWATHTFNPWREKDDTRIMAAESAWKEPLKWDREAKAAMEQWRADSYGFPFNPPYPKPPRPRVFCASMADVFEDWAGPISSHDGRWIVRPYLDSESGPENWQLEYPEIFKVDPQGWKLLTMADVRRRLFALIEATPNLRWLLLTKRPQNVSGCNGMPTMLPLKWIANNGANFPQNVWLGTTVENQQTADERIPHLLRAPARVRFLSCEPLLGPVDLSRFHIGWLRCTVCGEARDPDTEEPLGTRWNCGECEADRSLVIEGRFLHWVIAGGESGPHARPSHPNWFRSLRDQCVAAGVPFFFKQWGEWAPPDQVAESVFSNRPRFEAYEFPGLPVPMAEKGPIVYRVGKAAAGRLLDGREWDEVPS